jgi:hypothetical protein
MLERIADGRTDLVFDYLAQGHPADSVDGGGVSLIRWCAYYGDVSAVRYLVSRGASLGAPGENLGLVPRPTLHLPSAGCEALGG